MFVVILARKGGERPFCYGPFTEQSEAHLWMATKLMVEHKQFLGGFVVPVGKPTIIYPKGHPLYMGVRNGS